MQVKLATAICQSLKSMWTTIIVVVNNQPLLVKILENCFAVESNPSHYVHIYLYIYSNVGVVGRICCTHVRQVRKYNCAHIWNIIESKRQVKRIISIYIYIYMIRFPTMVKVWTFFDGKRSCWCAKVLNVHHLGSYKSQTIASIYILQYMFKCIESWFCAIVVLRFFEHNS